MSTGKAYLLVSILILAFCYHLSIILTIKSMLAQMEQNILKKLRNPKAFNQGLGNNPLFRSTDVIPSGVLLVFGLFLTAMFIIV